MKAVDNTVTTDPYEAIPGGILDVDGHEQTPIHLWGEVFGSSAGRIAEVTNDVLRRLNTTAIIADDLTADAMEITEESV
jgi:hypothetical protein